VILYEDRHLRSGVVVDIELEEHVWGDVHGLGVEGRYHGLADLAGREDAVGVESEMLVAAEKGVGVDRRDVDVIATEVEDHVARVGSRAAIRCRVELEDVVAVIAPEIVGTQAADERVSVLGAVKRVVAIAALDPVGAAVAPELVGDRAADQGVIVFGAGQVLDVLQGIPRRVTA